MHPPEFVTSMSLTVLNASPDDPLIARAVQLLAEWVEQRTGLRVRQVRRLPSDRDGPAIVVGLRGDRRGSPEAFTLRREAEQLHIVGDDGLGTLFGVGRLLRECRLWPGRIELPATLAVRSAPKMAIRGVQLGYRSINNTLDVWSLAQFEQHLQELALFGCNAVELTPPDSADEQPEWTMNLQLAELVHAYGMQVWLWLPITDGDATRPEERQRILAHRRSLFEAMGHIDHVLIPGGDPGDTPVAALLPLVRDIAAQLHASHPAAGMWLSHQGFEAPERDRLYRFLRRRRPEWLRGLVFGPWTRDTIEHTREVLPEEYALRAYPDLTHSCRCQYPVPRWDPAFALVEGREVCNPRPQGYRAVFERVAPYCDGFVIYSDGVHDDVHKMLWLLWGWDPAVKVDAALREYARNLVGPDVETEVARGLAALERNWRGAVRSNPYIPRTLALWERLQATHGADWRVQLHHFRALCDRYVQLRASQDGRCEQRALAHLRRNGGKVWANTRLELEDTLPNSIRHIRERLNSIGRQLRRSIGLQLAVELGGQEERGNVLDHLDEPLNNSRWILRQLAGIEDRSATEQTKTIARILSWEDPGPGGFYDDLGNAAHQRHLVVESSWNDDPDNFSRAYEDFSFLEYAESGRLSWRCQATTLYDTPLRVRYTGLDPTARYALRVVYAGRFRAPVRLIANGSIAIHGAVKPADPPKAREFALPAETTESGVLELEWRRVGTRGRGPQVAEVWLIRRE
jgi:hypothetical protein